ncbi:MAG: hypothetical protein JRI23_24245 [Deltaproteobacteria bacterium]|jgi:hypothetical protein|nr:hypothetical protein [Deltaproteobacteria bacterium]MBW2535109.1 hypothetical protein [Deltaproteobacteria bacterium]
MASSSWVARATLLVAVVVVVGAGAGCAEERDPINRVQANALPKSFFLGALHDPSDDPEFYMHVTVVDADVGAGSDGLFTNSDAQPTMRVRFEITEDLLTARLSYELIEDTDYRGVRRTAAKADGQIVAAYQIDKHFDIRRDYNPSTGEELNVIVENEEDRPWFEREYVRVDWSRNLVTTAYDLDVLSQLGIYYGVEFESVAYYVADSTHPDAPRFDVSGGYFDVTNKAFAKPGLLEDEWWGEFPACWMLGYWPFANCNPSEITLRQAFRRVPDTDYEPMHYDGTQMEMFGYFDVYRFGYDRAYGLADDKWHRFIARWNLFGQSHASPPVECATPATTPAGADPHRDDDGNGTEDECEAVGRGSRCDEFKGLCTLPYRDRPVRTIPWHEGPDNPDDLFESTREALQGWSDALRIAIIAGRLVECRRTGEPDCEAQMGWPVPFVDTWVPPVGSSTLAEVPEVFVLCHNPVDPSQGDDPELCGSAGNAPRLGDLRYNFLSVIQDPELLAPWGIMMDAWDPLTGEVVAGSVNVWGSVGDRAAAKTVDLVQLLNGQISPDEFITGQDVSEWVKANRPGGSAARGPRPMSAAEVDSHQRAFDPSVLTPYLAGMTGNDRHLPPKLRHERRAKALIDGGRLGPGNSALSARLRSLRGSPIEAAMVSPEMAQLAGFDPTGPVSPDIVRRASPFGRYNPAVRRQLRREKRIARAKRRSCRLEAPDPDNLIALARQLQQQYPAPDPTDPAAVQAWRDELWNWARRGLNRGVMAHELGHSMGLRHNFAASFDALNYDTRYWQLRTSNGETSATCADGNVNGSSCVGPRWKDPLTEQEINGNIFRYATSSVMDYPGDSNQDMILPGKYDRAALRFGYAGTVDVWANDDWSVDRFGAGQQTAFYLTAFGLNPGLFGVYYFPDTDPYEEPAFIHYSRYHEEFDLLGTCEPADGAGTALGQRCHGAPLDVVDYRDMRDFAADPDYASFAWAITPRVVDGAGRVRRGYQFSGDEYADAGNVPSFTSDYGADPYEQIRFLESQYENRYVLDAFRRDRVMFNSLDASYRIQAYYLDNMQQIVKTWAFAALLEGDPQNPLPALLDDGYYGPLQLGSTVAFDWLARIMTRPEPGYYCPADVCGYFQPLGVDEPVYVTDWAALPDYYIYDFQVALGDGRYLHNDYDYAEGYWWGDYQTQVGCYYDKIWSTYYLAEAFDYFISNAKEDFTDSRYKNVSFATVYPEQVRRLFNNLLTGDMETYAPWVDPPVTPNDTPLAALEYPDWHAVDGPSPRPAGVLLADPNHAWNEQIYAMVWGAMFFPTNWSLQWVHDARIAVLPSEQPDWPADEVVAFYYPPTGLTYRAHSTGTESIMGLTRQKAAGARMLEWANKLMTLAYLVDRDVGGEPIYNPDGTPVLLLDVDGKPQLDPANPGAPAALARYVDTIDTMRELTAHFEQALGDWDLPQP